MQLLGTATRFPQQPKGIRNGKHLWSAGSIQAMLQIIQEGLPSQSNDDCWQLNLLLGVLTVVHGIQDLCATFSRLM